MLVRWVRRVSLYFSQLPGNGALSETGSLMTASSSGESANLRSRFRDDAVRATASKMRRCWLPGSALDESQKVGVELLLMGDRQSAIRGVRRRSHRLRCRARSPILPRPPLRSCQPHRRQGWWASRVSLQRAAPANARSSPAPSQASRHARPTG
jgi:hypothetical protein